MKNIIIVILAIALCISFGVNYNQNKVYDSMRELYKSVRKNNKYRGESIDKLKDEVDSQNRMINFFNELVEQCREDLEDLNEGHGSYMGVLVPIGSNDCYEKIEELRR